MPRAPHAGRRGDVRRARGVRQASRGRSLSGSGGRPDLAALRAALIDPARARELPVHGRHASAVLVALYIQDSALHAVFTRRRADLRRHAGEISFPGGRQDPGDPSLEATALREAEEEIGLAPEDVGLLGALTPTPTVATNYAIHPFVGVIEPGTEWRLSPREVDEVLEVSLEELRAGYGLRRLVRRGVPFRTQTYLVGDQLIWGATARIVGDLLDRLAPG